MSESAHTTYARYRPASYYIDMRGYERWNCGITDKSVGVHRLVAVAEYGFDAVEGNVVHHKNEVPWDNRPENLEPMGRTEHSKHHYNESITEERIGGELCRKIRNKYPEHTIQELADTYGVGTSAIHNHLDADCCHVEESITLNYDGPRDGEWRDKELFEELYVDQDMTFKQLSNRWGCCVTTVSNWANKHGIETG